MRRTPQIAKHSHVSLPRSNQSIQESSGSMHSTLPGLRTLRDCPMCPDRVIDDECGFAALTFPLASGARGGSDTGVKNGRSRRSACCPVGRIALTPRSRSAHLRRFLVVYAATAQAGTPPNRQQAFRCASCQESWPLRRYTSTRRNVTRSVEA